MSETAVTRTFDPRDRRRLADVVRFKTRLLTLSDLDRRTAAFKNTSQLISGMEADLGGDLTVAQKQLVQRAALLGAMVEDLESRWLAGDPVAPEVVALLANAQRRVLATIGLERRSRNVTPTVDEYLKLEHGTDAASQSEDAEDAADVAAEDAAA